MEQKTHQKKITPPLLNFLRRIRREARKIFIFQERRIRRIFFIFINSFVKYFYITIQKLHEFLFLIRRFWKIRSAQLEGLLHSINDKLRKFRTDISKQTKIPDIANILLKEVKGVYGNLKEFKEQILNFLLNTSRGIKEKSRLFKIWLSNKHKTKILSKIQRKEKSLKQPTAVKLKLPHIPRILTANKYKINFKFITIVAGSAFLIHSYIPLNYRNNYVRFNNEPLSHYLLGEYLLSNNNYMEAEREFKLAGLLSKNQLVVNNKLQEVEKIKEEKMSLEKEVDFWEALIETKPDYRDAYLELALLNYQLKRPSTGKEYLEKAFELDPNYKITEEVAAIFNPFVEFSQR